MALFTGAFFVAQVSLIIVAKPFYSIKANNQTVEKVIKERPIAKIRDKPILTITEAATYIGVTRPTLYSYLKRGELKASRLGYKFLLKKEDIDNLFAK